MIIAHVLAAIFWISVALLVYTHVGYPLLLWLLSRVRGRGQAPYSTVRGQAPLSGMRVSLVIAAYNEGEVIERKIQNARALDYPELEIIVCSDGSTSRSGNPPMHSRSKPAWLSIASSSGSKK